MAIDMKMVRLGIHADRAALAKQGRYSLTLASQFSKELEENGWTAAMTKLLLDSVTWLETSEAIQNDMKEQSRGSMRSEVAAVTAAKEYVHRLRHMVPLAVRTTKVDVKEHAFEVGGELKRDPKRISQYLAKVSADVKRLDGDLKPYFKGQSAYEALVFVKNRLDGADALQDNTHSRLPEQTLRVYEAKGKVLQLISDLNRIGRVAFYGEAEKSGLFNKDLLLRSRRAEAKDEQQHDDATQDDVKKPA